MHSQLTSIQSFMTAFGQPIRTTPTRLVPYSERLLRARLILEEALEEVNALGFTVCETEQYPHLEDVDKRNETSVDEFIHENCRDDEFPVCLMFRDNLATHLSTILDGIVDQDYVSKGTLFTFGLQDLLENAEKLVHTSNMSKLWSLKQVAGLDDRARIEGLYVNLTDNGHYCVRRKDGKVVKPPTFKAPDLKGLIDSYKPTT